MRKGLRAIDFEAVFEAVPGLFLILLPDLTIVDASNDYLLATLTTREEIVGRYLFDVFPNNPDNNEADSEFNLRASLERVIRNCTADAMPILRYDVKRRDGTFEPRYWSPLNKPVLDDEKNLLYIIHRVMDVSDFMLMQETEKKQQKENAELRNRIDDMRMEIMKRTQEIIQMNVELEQKVIERTNRLIDSENQFKKALDIMLEGIQIIGFDWRYLYVNDSVVKHGRYSRKELIGYTMMEKYPGIEQSSLFKVLEECMHQRVPKHLENVFVYPDNSTGCFELSVQPFPEGIFILSIDISERKKAEDNVNRLNAELENRIFERTEQLVVANKELEAFSYSVSHDLRAPLRAIHGYAQILLEDYGKNIDDEGKRIAKVIMNNAERMGQLIDDLLAFSRLGKQQLIKGHFEMNPVMESVLSEFKMIYGRKNVEIHLSELPPAYGDRNLIRQVLVNLISNAIKYSSKKEKPIITIGSCVENGEQAYFIKDNGAGFDMRYYNKLFGVFQRLHSSTEFEGTGVGLAIVHRILQKHNGKVWAEGKVNEGATFFFSLPKIETNEKEK